MECPNPSCANCAALMIEKERLILEYKELLLKKSAMEHKLMELELQELAMDEEAAEEHTTNEEDHQPQATTPSVC